MKALTSHINMHTGNMTAIAAAVLLFVGGVQWQEYSDYQAQKAKDAAYRQQPASDWLDVEAIRVPDFEQGSDPNLIYEVARKVEVFGIWSAVIRPIGEASNEVRCTNTGNGKYKTTTKLPDKGVTLSWFMGKDCNLGPGQYVIELNITFTPDGESVPKTEEAFSNVFTVLPKP